MIAEDPQGLIEKSFEQHLSTIRALRDRQPLIHQMAGLMIKSLQTGGTIFWCGNGGSAADCQHLAAELIGRFKRERKGLASIALTTDSSILTALGNDYGYEHIFERQVEALAGPGDVLIGISTSGKSPNVLRAIEKARQKKAIPLGFSGNDGGQLAKVSELCLVVPSNVTAHIQEAHIMVGHILCDLIELAFC